MVAHFHRPILPLMLGLLVFGVSLRGAAGQEYMIDIGVRPPPALFNHYHEAFRSGKLGVAGDVRDVKVENVIGYGKQPTITTDGQGKVNFSTITVQVHPVLLLPKKPGEVDGNLDSWEVPYGNRSLTIDGRGRKWEVQKHRGGLAFSYQFRIELRSPLGGPDGEAVKQHVKNKLKVAFRSQVDGSAEGQYIGIRSEEYPEITLEQYTITYVRNTDSGYLYVAVQKDGKPGMPEGPKPPDRPAGDTAPVVQKSTTINFMEKISESGDLRRAPVSGTLELGFPKSGAGPSRYPINNGQCIIPSRLPRPEGPASITATIAGYKKGRAHNFPLADRADLTINVILEKGEGEMEFSPRGEGVDTPGTETIGVGSTPPPSVEPPIGFTPLIRVVDAKTGQPVKGMVALGLIFSAEKYYYQVAVDGNWVPFGMAAADLSLPYSIAASASGYRAYPLEGAPKPFPRTIILEPDVAPLPPPPPPPPPPPTPKFVMIKLVETINKEKRPYGGTPVALVSTPDGLVETGKRSTTDAQGQAKLEALKPDAPAQKYFVKVYLDDDWYLVPEASLAASADLQELDLTPLLSQLVRFKFSVVFPASEGGGSAVQQIGVLFKAGEKVIKDLTVRSTDSERILSFLATDLSLPLEVMLSKDATNLVARDPDLLAYASLQKFKEFVSTGRFAVHLKRQASGAETGLMVLLDGAQNWDDFKTACRVVEPVVSKEAEEQGKSGAFHSVALGILGQQYKVADREEIKAGKFDRNEFIDDFLAHIPTGQGMVRPPDLAVQFRGKEGAAAQLPVALRKAPGWEIVLVIPHNMFFEDGEDYEKEEPSKALKDSYDDLIGVLQKASCRLTIVEHGGSLPWYEGLEKYVDKEKKTLGSKPIFRHDTISSVDELKALLEKQVSARSTP